MCAVAFLQQTGVVVFHRFHRSGAASVVSLLVTQQNGAHTDPFASLQYFRVLVTLLMVAASMQVCGEKQLTEGVVSKQEAALLQKFGICPRELPQTALS